MSGHGVSRGKFWWASSLFLLRDECPRILRARPANISCILLRLAVLGAALLVVAPEISLADEVDFTPYTRAADYCRGNVPRPIALSADKRVLCFDGEVRPRQDYSAVNALEDGGLFVVRSPGGDISTAIVLANSVRDRHAVVVVYDYCISACASYLAMASTKTLVLKDTIVAWHYTTDPSWCPTLAWPRDDGPQRLEKKPCYKAARDEEDAGEILRHLDFKFYQGRAVDCQFEDPPESFTIRRILRHMFEDTGKYPEVTWTWNPRYYPDALIVKIIYEAYPTSQAEVDALAARFHSSRVLYDP